MMAHSASKTVTFAPEVVKNRAVGWRVVVKTWALRGPVSEEDSAGEEVEEGVDSGGEELVAVKSLAWIVAFGVDSGGEELGVDSGGEMDSGGEEECAGEDIGKESAVGEEIESAGEDMGVETSAWKKLRGDVTMNNEQ